MLAILRLLASSFSPDGSPTQFRCAPKGPVFIATGVSPWNANGDESRSPERAVVRDDVSPFQGFTSSVGMRTTGSRPWLLTRASSRRSKERSTRNFKSLRNQVRSILAIAFVVLLTPLGSFAADTKPIAIGNRRELFVDDALIDQLKGKAEQRLHSPQPREVVLVHDAPWEGSGSGYHSLFQDGNRYRMYYRAAQLDIVGGKMRTDDHPSYLCYAESDDGLTWRKPKLGLCDFRGSTDNNIVLSAELTSGVPVDVGHPAVFKDDNPNVSADARYKAFFAGKGRRGLVPFQSPDGLHWKPMAQTPVITDGAFDSQNLAFWDPNIQAYRAYWRYFTGGVTNDKEWKPSGFRDVRTAVSRDLLTWSDQANLKYVDSPSEQVYTNGVKPYARAPHILIGLPTRYVDRGWSEAMRALPEREHREARSAVNKRYGTAVTETQLMASRDGVQFKRWNEAFIRPGPERSGTWLYGHLYTAWHMVETRSAIDGGPELSFYSSEGYWAPPGTALRRYALRLDGFVSVHAPSTGGELITRPITFTGDKLQLNFATSAVGSIRVELQTPDGRAIEGFAMDDCPEMFGDTLERQVLWSASSELKSLTGKPVRLRFVMKDADLFAFQFK